MTLFMTELHVVDPESMARWYAEVLGLRIVLRDFPKGFVLLEAPGGGRLALKRSERGGSGCRLVFQVEDPDAERVRLQALAISVSEASDNTEESYREVRLTDPEGTPITLFAWSGRTETG
ncbi:VOC family protein [Tautonia rosea]|uniref:VOC family protein n=1 Tax=Tautonia rosea TaxID=2728037 RepID=UPI001473C65E|nr:VOC family protein [Tautonia rosea]